MPEGIGSTGSSGASGSGGNAGSVASSAGSTTPTTNAVQAPAGGQSTESAAPARDYSQPKGSAPNAQAADAAPVDGQADGATDQTNDNGEQPEGTDAPAAAPSVDHPFGVDPALVQSAISMLMGEVANLNNPAGASPQAPAENANGPQHASQTQAPAANASGEGFLSDEQIAKLKAESVDDALIDGALVPMNKALKAAHERNAQLEQRFAAIEQHYRAQAEHEAKALDEQVDQYLAGEVSKLGLADVYGTQQAKQTPQQRAALMKVGTLAQRIIADKHRSGQPIQPLEAIKLAMAVSHLDKFQAAARKAAVEKVTPGLEAQQRVMSPRRVGQGGNTAAPHALDDAFVSRYSAPKPR